MTKQRLRDKLVEKLNYKTWTRRVLARNAKGEEVNPLSKQAVRWCVGGLQCKISKRSWMNSSPEWIELKNDFVNKWTDSITETNDKFNFSELKKRLINLY
jgi:hypothetical protein